MARHTAVSDVLDEVETVKDEVTYKRANTPTEFLRLAEALAPTPPRKWERGTKLWIVASSRPPLHRIQGIFEERAKAIAALREGPPYDDVWPWSKEDQDARVIYGPIDPQFDKWSGEWRMEDAFEPQYGSGEVIDPCTHLTSSEPCCPTYAFNPHPAISSAVEEMTLEVIVSDGKARHTVRYPLHPRSDAVFLTASAKNKFMLPHYHPRYATALTGRALPTPEVDGSRRATRR